MPAPYPRRRWRFVVAGAVSAVLLAGGASCGEPSHAREASAPAPAAAFPWGAAGSETSATTAASPTASTGASTPTKVAPPAAGSSSSSAKAKNAGGGQTPGSTPSGGSTPAGGSTTHFVGSSTVLIGGGMSDA